MRVFVWWRVPVTWVRRVVAMVTTTWIATRSRVRTLRETAGSKRRASAFARHLEAMRANACGREVMPLSEVERSVLREIRQQTRRMNRNNLTRTEAYLVMYTAHPELHWALLAHLVSRNGGYSMTDLQGDAAVAIAGNAERHALFRFLERCNWLIFADAYPQLLVYCASVQRQTSLYHLLPYLQTSVFMQAAWASFAETGDRKALTIAQIINEQSHIEERVVKNPWFMHTVFSQPVFNAQSLLHATVVIFPALDADGVVRHVYGNRVRDFTSIEERVDVGKMLYSVLFQNQDRPLTPLLRFARCVPHTGSRADYLPSWFAAVRTEGRLYSPPLTEAWPDQTQRLMEPGDWYTSDRALRWLTPVRTERLRDMMPEYLRAVREVSHLAQILGPVMHPPGNG